MTDSEFLAHECNNGHLTYPAHTRCPDCGESQCHTVDISNRCGKIITWTTVRATPMGVSEPNTLAIVEFTIDERTVQAIGRASADIEVGDTVRPVYVEELRNPDTSIRARESQSWDGYRFESIK